MGEREIVFLSPEETNEGWEHGGPPAMFPMPPGILWPPVRAKDRQHGCLTERKLFIHLRGQPTGEGNRLRLCLNDLPHPGGDRLWLSPGTPWDRLGERDSRGAPRYGVALLAEEAAPDHRELVIAWPETHPEAWRGGEPVRLWEPTTGREAWLLLDPDHPPRRTGARLHLPLAPGERLRLPFPPGCPVAAVLESGPLTTWCGEWSLWSRGGHYRIQQGHHQRGGMVLDPAGCVAERWRLTFLSPTHFQCQGERLGTVGEGETRVPFAPTDPATGIPYFRLAPTGWGGRWRPGEGLGFTTLPPLLGVWLTREIPPGALPTPGRKPGLEVVCLGADR